MKMINFIFPRKIQKILKMYFYERSEFGYYGENVSISHDTVLSNPQNVYLYGNNGLQQAIVLTTNAKFIMKQNSGASFGLKVSTGNHARIIGIPYRCITEVTKPENLDQDVVVEEDVWIGMNVTLLCGVTVKRGATIAAGSVVNKSVPPYSICGGMPAKFIKFYWTIDQIIEHEKKIYEENERYTRDELENIFKTYLKKPSLK